MFNMVNKAYLIAQFSGRHGHSQERFQLAPAKPPPRSIRKKPYPAQKSR
jgi:hypothetical protein